MSIPDEIIEALNEIHQYASQVDEWIVLKRILLNSLPAPTRTLFSTRHPISKRTWTNDLEIELANMWSKLTGRPIIFKDDEGKSKSEIAP